MRRLGDDMKAIKPADVVVLTDKAQAKLAGIQAKAEDLRAKFPQFTVQINDKVAKAELDLFAADAKKKLGDLDQQIAGSAGSGRGGFAALAASLTGVGDAADAAGSKGSLFARGWAAANLATGLAESSVSALAIAVGSVAAAATAAGIGLAAYSAAAGPVIKQATDAMAAQQALDKATTTAQANYTAAIAAGASPATAAAARTRALTAAQVKYTEAVKGTPAPVMAFAASLTKTKDAYKAWADSLAVPVLAPMTAALKLVDPLLKDMTPFVKEASAAMTELIGKLGAGIQSTGFQAWLADMLPLVRPVITGIGTAIGNIVVGIGGILDAFTPFVPQILHGVDDITGRFRTWGTTLSGHSGFQAIVSQWKDAWPNVREGLGKVLDILVNIAKAMASMVTPGNSSALWNVANPLLTLADKLSAHPQLVTALLYILAIGKGGGQIKSVFDSMKTGWGALSGIVSALTGGKISLGMQGAGDTMLVASRNMQRAADTMVGAGAAAGKGGAAAGAAKAAAPGAALGGLSLGAFAGLAAGGAGIGAGFILSIKNAIQSGWQGVLKILPSLLGGVGGILNLSATGWTNAILDHFATPVRKLWADLGHFLASSFDVTRAQVAGIAASLWHQVTGSFDQTRAQVTGIWNTVWNNTVTRAANGVKDVIGWFNNLRAGAVTAYNTVKTDIANAWNAVWANTRAVVSAGIAWVAGEWRTLQAGVVSAYNAVRANIAAAWSAIWANTRAVVSAGVAAVAGFWNTLKAGVVSAYNTVRTSIASAWSAIWANTRAAVSAGVASVVTFFTGLPGKITSALGAAGKLLASWGSGVINGLLSGAKSVWQSVVNFFTGVPKAILHALGINSPPQWAIDAGKHIMNGIGIGVSFAKGVVSKATAAQIQQAAVSGVAGPGGGAPAANAALARKMMPAWGSGAEWTAWNYLEMREAGWNQFARNPSSGAYGIPQALPPGKMGTAANPPQSNPAAQISWMIGYIKSRYGDPINAAAHERAFNWYAGGTSSAAPGWAWVGERGPELVRFRGGEQVAPYAGSGGGQDGLLAELRALRAELRHLNATAAAIPAATGRHVGGAINGAAGAASFRNRYPQGGA
jgi:hypothetical protein